MSVFRSTLTLLFISALKRDLVFAFCGFDDVSIQELGHYFILLENDNAWSLQINVSWTVSGQGYDGYYVDAFLKDSVAFDQYGCDARLGYEYTPQPWYVFSGYQFRHEYEIKIKLFNNATGKNSFSPTTFHVSTPDCYEETGSVEFCASQPIPVSSKVREPRIESVQENIYQNGTDVVVSWLPPVQINGALRYIALSYRPQDQIPYEGIERYYPSEIEWDGGLETRFISDFPVSKEDIIYVLNIRPYVDIGGNGGSSTSGEDLEIVFNSTIKQVTLTSTTAKEHHFENDNVSSTQYMATTFAPGGIESVFDFILDEWQWIVLFTVVFVLVLVALVTVIILIRKRKGQQQSVDVS
ncbi:uncharacterized protein [Apostichopus japonicus]|uniref:uncharacterized protein n=1 Tax=Stichopus japonicus TaxID=307972 RepID=UPI003AB7C7A1